MKPFESPSLCLAAGLAIALFGAGCSWHVPVQVIDAANGNPLPGAQVTAISAKSKKGKFKRKINQAITGLNGKAEIKLPRKMEHHRIQFEKAGYWQAGATIFTWRTGEPEVLLVSPDDLSRVPRFLRIDEETTKHERLPPGIRQTDKTFFPGRTVITPLYPIGSLEPNLETPKEFKQDLPGTPRPSRPSRLSPLPQQKTPSEFLQRAF